MEDGLRPSLKGVFAFAVDDPVALDNASLQKLLEDATKTG